MAEDKNILNPDDLTGDTKFVYELIGWESTLKLISACGGREIYIGSYTTSKPVKLRYIEEQLAGLNEIKAALAVERMFGVTHKVARRLVKEARRNYKKQLKLFT